MAGTCSAIRQVVPPLITLDEDYVCQVCGDLATGRHYGILACTGCKCFFRRSICGKMHYNCRTKQKCVVNKNTRAVCRLCRFQKCVKAGMQADAVHKERNTTSSIAEAGPPSIDSVKYSKTPLVFLEPKAVLYGWATGDELLSDLRSAEQEIQAIEPVVIAQQLAQIGAVGSEIALIVNMFISCHTQLLLAAEWTKRLAPFTRLPITDQYALMRNFCKQQGLLNLAYRSRHDETCLILATGQRVVMNYTPLPGMPTPETCLRIKEELSDPLRKMNVDHDEFLLLKACVLFDPAYVEGGLMGQSSGAVNHIRRQISAALEYRSSTWERAKELILTFMGPLMMLSTMMSEDILVTKLAGLAEVGRLTEEIFLYHDECK